MTILENIPGLAMEANEDGTITLEQYVCGNAERVAIHPVHVRQLAERLGLIAAPTDKSAAELQRENARHRCSLLRIRENALSLQIDFAEHADHRHADLTTEMWRINALVDLLDMAVEGFAGCDAASDGENPGVTQPEPSGSPVRPATHPKTAVFGAPPKAGALGRAADVTPCHAKRSDEHVREGAPSAPPADPAPPQHLHPAAGAPLKASPLQLDLEGGNVR